MPRPTKRTGRRDRLQVPGGSFLSEHLTDFSAGTGELKTPDAVLNALNDATSQAGALHVLGAGRFPAQGR